MFSIRKKVQAMGSEENSNHIDWARRKQIFDKGIDHRGSIHYTYQRNYFAAKCVGWLGWALDGFTAILGGILIFVLQAEGPPQAPTYLAVGILISSLMSSFYGPKLRSRDYYKAGQEHQQLHDDFDHFINIEISDPSLSNKELQNKLEDLNERRHRLNQSTPQLGGIWYYTMQSVGKIKHIYSVIIPWKDVSKWEPETYDEIIPQEAKESLNCE